MDLQNRYQALGAQLNGGKVNNRTLANAIRFLSIDAVNNANSGHPGAPMGMADIATILWREFLKHNPKIRIGLTETGSFYLMATVQCSYTHFFT